MATDEWYVLMIHILQLALHFVFQTCVRRESMLSVMMGRNIEESDARAVIDKVFDKCYNDTEPFGRRMRTFIDEEQALKEGLMYGYTPSKVERDAQKPENMKP